MIVQVNEFEKDVRHYLMQLRESEIIIVDNGRILAYLSLEQTTNPQKYTNLNL